MANFLESVAKAATSTLMKPVNLFQRKLKKNLFMKSKVVTAIKASLKEFMVTLKKAPAKRADYVTLGDRMYAKRLLMVVLLFIVFMMVIGNSLVIPLLRGRLYTPTIALSDGLLTTYSGKAHLINREKVLIYDGMIGNGKCNGYGKQYDDKGRLRYAGDFEEDLYEGQGTLYDVNGNKVYEGQFTGNFFEGKGKLFDQSGKLKYSGEFSQGLENGYGLAYYDNGKVQYAGDFLNGKYHGEGNLFSISNERVYSGSFVNGLYEGSGKSFYEKEVLAYEGFFSLGEYSGLGRLYSQTGKLIYEGSFLQGEYYGMGKAFDATTGELAYNGNFENGLYSGSGALYVGSDKVYEGPWVAGAAPLEDLIGKLSTDVRVQFAENGQMIEMDGVYGLNLKKTGVVFELNYPEGALEPTVQKIMVSNFAFSDAIEQQPNLTGIMALYKATKDQIKTVKLADLPDQAVYKTITNLKSMQTLTLKQESCTMLFYFDEATGQLVLYEYRPLQE